MHWYIDVFRKWKDFSGRSGRQEFWMFFVSNFFVGCVVAIVDMGLGETGFIVLAYSLLVLCPGLALWVRRIHDLGGRGWLALLLLIPCVNTLFVLVVGLMKGQDGVTIGRVQTFV